MQQSYVETIEDLEVLQRLARQPRTLDNIARDVVAATNAGAQSLDAAAPAFIPRHEGTRQFGSLLLLDSTPECSHCRHQEIETRARCIGHMIPPVSHEVTHLLRAWSQGDRTPPISALSATQEWQRRVTRAWLKRELTGD